MADPGPSPVPDRVVDALRMLDVLVGRVEPRWWGAVITDRRFPVVWDVNYARIDAAAPDLGLEEIELSLLPALAAAGATTEHVVAFHPDAVAPVLDALVARGHSLSHDLVMELADEPPDDGMRRAEPLPDGPELWEAIAASLSVFGIDGDDAFDQLRTIERAVLVPGGKRWFCARDVGGRVASVGAMLLLGPTAYIDNVATLEHARGNGLASAVTTRMVREAGAAGATGVFLLADPGDRSVVRLYERIGFRGAGLMASTKGAVPDRLTSADGDDRPEDPGTGSR